MSIDWHAIFSDWPSGLACAAMGCSLVLGLACGACEIYLAWTERGRYDIPPDPALDLDRWTTPAPNAAPLPAPAARRAA
jgi:hypothetical protein